MPNVNEYFQIIERTCFTGAAPPRGGSFPYRFRCSLIPCGDCCAALQATQRGGVQRVWAQPMCVLESRDVPGLRGAEGPACRGWLPGEGVGRLGRVGAVDRAQRLARGAGCRSGRALPACHVNKKPKGAMRPLFFRAREKVRWLCVEASGPRLGRSPAWGVCRPPAPLGCAPCVPFGTRAPATCCPVGRGVEPWEREGGGKGLRRLCTGPKEKPMRAWRKGD